MMEFFNIPSKLEPLETILVERLLLIKMIIFGSQDLHQPLLMANQHQVFLSLLFAFFSTCLIGGYDLILMKYSPQGDLLLTTQTGTTGDDQGYGIAIDKDGNIVVTGYTVQLDSYQESVLAVRYDNISKFIVIHCRNK